MAGPGDQEAAATAAGRGRLRASHADREHVIDTLKAAFVQGLYQGRVCRAGGQTFFERTYAELAPLTADMPAGLAAAAQPPRARPAPRASSQFCAPAG